MGIRLRDVHGAGLDGLAVGRLLHPQAAATGEQARQHAAVTRIHVLDDQDGRREVDGQSLDDDVQRFDPAGRRPDRNDVELGDVRRASLVSHLLPPAFETLPRIEFIVGGATMAVKDARAYRGRRSMAQTSLPMVTEV
jgi:hypothetical protein